MPSFPRVCIVGPGCSGFTTAKAFADRGIPFDCFEMSDQVGGNWAFKNKNGRSACCKSLHIDTSKSSMQFADFPIPSHFPDYPHHSQVPACCAPPCPAEMEEAIRHDEECDIGK